MEVLKTTSPVVKPEAPIEIPRNLVPSASTNTADIFRDKMALQYLRIQGLGTGYTKREKFLAAPVSNIVDIIVDLAP